MTAIRTLITRRKRSRAAVKGWETRRRNELSDRARRGWETRRANA
jgi:hypothetical protein